MFFANLQNLFFLENEDIYLWHHGGQKKSIYVNKKHHPQVCGAVIVGQAKDALSFCESLLQNQCKQSEVKLKHML